MPWVKNNGIECGLRIACPAADGHTKNILSFWTVWMHMPGDPNPATFRYPMHMQDLRQNGFATLQRSTKSCKNLITRQIMISQQTIVRIQTMLMDLGSRPRIDKDRSCVLDGNGFSMHADRSPPQQ